jgi:hypothetical protein
LNLTNPDVLLNVSPGVPTRDFVFGACDNGRDLREEERCCRRIIIRLQPAEFEQAMDARAP